MKAGGVSTLCMQCLTENAPPLAEMLGKGAKGFRSAAMQVEAEDLSLVAVEPSAPLYDGAEAPFGISGTR